MKNNNTWNIRHLVDETIVPSTKPIILKIVGFVDIWHEHFSSWLHFHFESNDIYHMNINIWLRISFGISTFAIIEKIPCELPILCEWQR